MELQRYKLTTLPREMTLKEILTEYPIPLEYASCFVILAHRGSNIATQGTKTWQKYIFMVADGKAVGMLYNYVNRLENADYLPKNIQTWTSENGGYFAVQNNSITANDLTNNSIYYAAGNELYYTQMPYNYVMDSPDYTVI